MAHPAASTTPLTRELWAGIEGTYAAILDHPFVTGLTDGSLPREAFLLSLIHI